MVLKANGRSLIPFAYGTITLYGRPFQYPSTRDQICNFFGSQWRPAVPYNPYLATATALTQDRFGLFPFRSPLLRE